MVECQTDVCYVKGQSYENKPEDCCGGHDFRYTSGHILCGVGFSSVRVTQHYGEAGNPNPVERARNIEDVSVVKKLTSFFPNVGQGRRSHVVAGWEASVVMVFTRPDGTVLRVTSDFESWSERNGDWPVKGDLAKYVDELFAAPEN